jgi:Ca2+-binding EF-hand superfamily protein
LLSYRIWFFFCRFAHFDGDNSSTLEKHEFKACLSALGISKNDAEMDQIMSEVASNQTTIRFDEFAEFMSKLNDKSDTADNMSEAFKTVRCLLFFSFCRLIAF